MNQKSSKFILPTEEEIQQAFGDISILSEEERILYEIIHRHSSKITAPDYGDWLAEEEEEG